MPLKPDESSASVLKIEKSFLLDWIDENAWELYFSWLNLYIIKHESIYAVWEGLERV